MSIRIDKHACVGCGRCMEVCPGNLIKKDENGLAEIIREKDCWGCTSCVKECKLRAIQFYLGADMGGKGSVLTIEEHGDLRDWIVTSPDGEKKVITVNTKESNKY